MTGEKPKNTVWQGLAWLAGAAVLYLLVSGDGVSAKNLAMGWIAIVSCTVIGIFVLTEALGIR